MALAGAVLVEGAETPLKGRLTPDYPWEPGFN